jgi:quinol monooxygenase YgiN
MFLTLVRVYPNSAERESVRRFLLGVVGPTRVQPGCLGCTLASESEPEALLYMETWESTGDLLRRLQSAEFGKVLEAMESSACAPEFSVFELTHQQGLELIERVRKVGWQRGEESQPPAEQNETQMLYHPNDRITEEDPI